jgi:hypothetical protein
MRVTLPLLALLSVVIYLMMRYRSFQERLTVPEFILCATWGFLLAQSMFAPMAQDLLNAVTGHH